MSGKIFLTSCGLKEKHESEKFYEKLKLELAGKRALVAINATTTGHNERAIEPTIKKFREGGSTAEPIILTAENIYSILGVDFLYVVGGDVAPLLRLAESKEVKATIKKFLEKGGTYIGESAGSIIMGKSAKWYYDLKKNTHERYSVKQNSYAGFGLVTEKIYPHVNLATPEQFQKISEYEAAHRTAITRLADGEFIEKRI